MTIAAISFAEFEKAVAWLVQTPSIKFTSAVTIKHHADSIVSDHIIAGYRDASVIPLYATPSIPTGYRLVLVEPKLIGWRMADYTHETDSIETARNWSSNVAVLPIFEGDPNTKIAAAPEVL